MTNRDWVKRPRGAVRMSVWKCGRLLYRLEGPNLFVNSGLPALAALLGGDTSGEYGIAVGFGSGTAAPQATDTGLTTPAYYKAIDSHSEDGDGGVTFNWSLNGGTDTGANGITIAEMGLFGNTGSVSLPGSSVPAPMLARRTFTAIAFGSSMSLSGQWIFTF